MGPAYPGTLPTQRDAGRRIYALLQLSKEGSGGLVQSLPWRPPVHVARPAVRIAQECAHEIALESHFAGLRSCHTLVDHRPAIKVAAPSAAPPIFTAFMARHRLGRSAVAAGDPQAAFESTATMADEGETDVKRFQI